MKRARQQIRVQKNFENFISKLSENEILDSREMKCVRGGEGDLVPPIIIPPPPPPPPR